MITLDDDLKNFEAHGVPSLMDPSSTDYTEHKNAKIWSASYGKGPVVILLHGGLGHSGNWGYQVPALVSAGYQVVTVDSRGHGRSTRDQQPYTYELMASDVLAVMVHHKIKKAAFVGWSDGACSSLVLAMKNPERVNGVFFFGCNMDPSGTKPFVMTPTIERCFNRHVKDYAQLSSTPDQFKAFSGAVDEMMKTEPNYNAQDLGKIKVPVTIAQSEFDEFIKPEHATYLHQSIPGSEFVSLKNVSHFAPLQKPDLFNQTVIHFLKKISL